MKNKELISELGLLETEEDSIKEDVLGFLDKFTGSPEATVKIQARDLKNYAKGFVDSDKGAIYFARRGPRNEWRHGESREDVVNALPKLMKQWLREREVVIQETENAEDAKAVRARKAKPHSTSWIGEWPTTTPDTRQNDRNEKRRPPTLGTKIPEDKDEDYIESSCTRLKQERDSSNDIVDVVHERRRYQNLSESRNNLPWSSGEEPLAEFTPADSTLEPQDGHVVVKVVDCTPGREAGARLSRLQLTSPKRKHSYQRRIVDSEDEAQIESEVNENDPKRARLKSAPDLSRTVRQPIVVPQVDMAGTELSSTLAYGDDAPQPGQIPRSITVAEDVSMTETTEEHRAQPLISLSRATGDLRELLFTQEAVRDIPMVILDYLRHCERSGLKKASDSDISAEERRRHQDRCKLVRDIRGDIESRIINLSTAGKGSRLDSPESGTSQICVTSYALWD